MKLAQEVLNTITERVKAGKVSGVESVGGRGASTSRIEQERAKSNWRRRAGGWRRRGAASRRAERVAGQLDQVKAIPSAFN